MSIEIVTTNAVLGAEIRGVDLARPLDDATFCEIERAFTHPSVIKTTFLLYFATPAGISSTCDATGAVSIIGRWKPFV